MVKTYFRIPLVIVENLVTITIVILDLCNGRLTSWVAGGGHLVSSSKMSECGNFFFMPSTEALLTFWILISV